MDGSTRDVRNAIENGKTSIGIELGSTRIKTVLIDAGHRPVASGSHDWENAQIDGLWTYSLEDVWKGIRDSYRKMAENVRKEYGVDLRKTASIGISAMMHGYLPFDGNGTLLVPFRTWRNNTTGPAADALTENLGYPIPQRWSIAHLYQAVLNREPHVPDIRFMTSLAGYVHWQLTGRRVLGVGDASGVFPVDLKTRDYDTGMADTFDRMLRRKKYPWKILDLLPEVRLAGQDAGSLTMSGAALLDESGRLSPGIPLCPPEGDAGTGMVATNSIAVRTGNVSAGTSVFAMIVLEKALSRVYRELDLLTTPEGTLVAMAHSNNCTSDTDAWIGLFAEAVKALGMDVPKPKLYDTLLGMALSGDADCGGLLAYGYVSGEHLTGFEEGRPLFARSSGSRFTLANFMRAQLFGSLGALRTGLDRIFVDEAVCIDEIRGHGGFFKTREVGQRIMAAATNTPISVMETAGEGGAWGIALLAAYRANKGENETLADYLGQKVFAGQKSTVVRPDPADVEGFGRFFRRYSEGLPIERAAVEHLK